MGDAARTLILSDTHLGKGGALSAEMLAPLWRGFDRVVFNGDTAELQMPRHHEQAEREVWRLRELAAKDGVELVLICGNHDAYISAVQSLSLMDGRVLVTHGHALHPAVAPWCAAGRVMDRMTRQRLAALPTADADDLDARLAVAREVAAAGFALEPTTQREGGLRVRDMLTHPWYALRVLDYWREAPRLAAAFLERYAPSAEVLVVGHSHRQGVWQRGGRTVINTGCFGFPGRPRAVVAEGAALSVVDVEVSRSGCVLAESPRFEMTLAGGGAAEESPRDLAA